jgi:hypothetical protein
MKSKEYWNVVHEVMEKTKRELEEHPDLYPPMKCKKCGRDIDPRPVYYPIGHAIHGCANYECNNPIHFGPLWQKTILIYRRTFKEKKQGLKTRFKDWLKQRKYKRLHEMNPYGWLNWFEADNKYLIGENNDLRKENKDLKNKIRTLEGGQT